MQDAAATIVPSFVLYGEASKGDFPDLVHIEALKDRSQRHDWKIKPHRHFGLMQLMQFRTSEVRIHLDGVTDLTETPAILMVPPGVIHGFQFSPDVVGSVTSIPWELIQNAIKVTQQPALITSPGPYFANLAQLLDQIQDEYRAQRQGREQALLALVRLIGLWIERYERDRPDGGRAETFKSEAERRIRSFLVLVEQHYQRSWGTSDYGKAIGASKSQLTRDCRAILQKSPLQVIHERVIKEANRKLAYTSWPIATISERLGFTDLGYFSRFYRQKTGETPTDYRTRIRHRLRTQPSEDPCSPKPTV